jgi:N-acyl-phosphatidylethanolamine-hydrolysing phospholipase D
MNKTDEPAHLDTEHNFEMLSSIASWATNAENKNRPAHWDNDAGTAFRNPWPSAEKPTWAELMQGKFPLGWYDDLKKKHPGTKDVSVITPDWGESDLKKRGLERQRCIVGTTLGHAGVITELPLEGTEGEDGKKKSFWVVYDPIFSLRAGPTQYTGPERLRPPPCQVTDIPG